MLIRDCEALLVSKDTLRGTGPLNWATDTAISAWDGITVVGTPQRVTKLKLANKRLNGSIQSCLGRMYSGLTHLDLSGNSLTGEIPPELGEMPNLESLKLSGNNFTECIPARLRDTGDHDLARLGLSYCEGE